MNGSKPWGERGFSSIYEGMKVRICFQRRARNGMAGTEVEKRKDRKLGRGYFLKNLYRTW